MKWILTSLLIFNFTVSFSQHKPVEFPDSGAKFTFIHITFWGGITTTEIVSFEHVRDTQAVFGTSQDSQLIKIFKGDGISNSSLAYITIDSNGILWYGWHGKTSKLFHFDLAFDSNKGVGDKLPDGEITKIDLFKSNGIKRKRFFLGKNEDPHYIEGIGYTAGLFHSFGLSSFVSHMELLCFSVNDTVTYTNPKYGTCDTSWYGNLSVHNPMPKRMVSAYGKSLQVNIPNGVDAAGYKLLIHDVSGKLVGSIKVDSNCKQTFAFNLKDGLYLYSLLSNERVLERGKVVLR